MPFVLDTGSKANGGKRKVDVIAIPDGVTDIDYVEKGRVKKGVGVFW